MGAPLPRYRSWLVMTEPASPAACCQRQPSDECIMGGCEESQPIGQPTRQP